MLPLNRSRKMAFHSTQAILPLLLALILLTGWLCPAQAADKGKLELTAGKSLLINTDSQIKRVSIADPAIADFVLISPTEVYLTARTAGATNMIVWQDKGRHDIYELEVGYDLSRLKHQLHEILPNETDLRITSAQDALTLSGRVSNAANLSQALTLARSYAPEGKVHNIAEVRGVQQVMLEVRVAEMQRSLLRRLGVNFNYFTESGNFGYSLLAGLTQLDEDKIILSPAVNAIFGFSSNGTSWTGFIDAMKQDGLIKVLAEPTLIALSGEKAEFLAGGEFPIPVPQGDETIAIEFKKFGVSLAFTPTVLGDGKINIVVAPEVSELDFTSTVQFAGFVVPGISSRKASTVVELADGQSFAIAGLMRENVRDVVQKFPLLGDIPVLGALFRSRSFQSSETELIIIATPRLVKPLDNANQPLPTDFYVEPTDAEFYLLGAMEGQERRPENDTIRGELDGEFGHAMPKGN